MSMDIKLVMYEAGDFPCYPEHWADVRSAFDIPFVYRVGSEQSKGFVHIPHGQEIIYHPRPDDDCRVCVVVAPHEAEEDDLDPTSLVDYQHSYNSVYVFGPDNLDRGWHKNWDTASTDYVVIRTPSATELYASHAAAMVMYDRICKLRVDI